MEAPCRPSRIILYHRQATANPASTPIPVILSVVLPSRSEGRTESKDPYTLNPANPSNPSPCTASNHTLLPGAGLRVVRTLLSARSCPGLGIELVIPTAGRACPELAEGNPLLKLLGGTGLQPCDKPTKAVGFSRCSKVQVFRLPFPATRNRHTLLLKNLCHPDRGGGTCCCLWKPHAFLAVSFCIIVKPPLTPPPPPFLSS